MSKPTPNERLAASLSVGNAQLDWLAGVFDRYKIGVAEHGRGALCEADARLLWGELDDAGRSVLAMSAEPDLAPWHGDLEGLAVRLAEARDDIREMF